MESVCYIQTGNVFWDLVYARPGGGIVGFIPETNLSSGAQPSIC
ncbi:hypothetical protein ABGB18_31750 [Nonomuraea sp. B12E4]